MVGRRYARPSQGGAESQMPAKSQSNLKVFSNPTSDLYRSLRIHACLVFRSFWTRGKFRAASEMKGRNGSLRLWSGSISRPITTCSSLGIRWTFKASASSLVLSIKVLASVLWPLFRARSATRSGCSENLAPQEITVATRAGWRCFPGADVLEGCNRSPLRNCSGLRRGSRVCTIWKKTSTRSRANL